MRAQTVFLQLLPRHPLLRLLVLAGGAVLLAGLLTLSLIVGALVLGAASAWLLVRRWLAGRKRDDADPAIIEGEFTVLSERRHHSLPGTD